MIYGLMLDTNIVSHIMKYPTGAAGARVRTLSPGDACMSIFTLAELRFGARKIGSQQLWRKIDQFVAYVPALAFEPPAELHYADIRDDLERRGQPIGPVDMFIAAHALSLDLTLVTANVREFSRVPGLKVENWLD